MRIGKTTFRKLLAVSLVIFVGFSSATAQESWSLQRCIEFARQNSLSLKQSQYGIDLAKLTDQQNRLARLPNLSASANGGWQFGRTIDPTTNSFDNQTIAFNNLGLNAGVTVFSGGLINNTIKQGKIDVEVAQEDAQATFNSIALNIANSYLQILMAEEQLENAVKRRSLSQQQLDQTDKLISAGTLPANDRLDVLALIASDEQSIVSSQNLIDLNYLTLKELMQLDPATEIKVERPEFTIPADANPEALTFGMVYSSALGTQPQVRADELRLESAEVSVDLARSGFYPTLSLFGGLDSRWSGVSKLYEPTTKTVTQSFFIPSTQTSLDVQYDVPDAIEQPYGYFDQLQDNFGQNIGASLQIPLYSNGRNSIAVERAKVGILNARVQADLTKQQLKNDVQQSLASARAARRTLDASQKSVDAAKVAFENAEKRFQLGSINNLQLLTARNTYDIAETNLIVSKYDYLFRLKILDFYLGREIKLD